MGINKCKLYCRVFQKFMYVGLSLMPWREPELITGAGCLKDVAAKLQELGLKHPLIVTDGFLHSIRIYAPLTDEMDKLGMPYSIYGEAVPNPTVHNVAAAYKMFVYDGFDCLIAVGGGSAQKDQPTDIDQHKEVKDPCPRDIPFAECHGHRILRYLKQRHNRRK